MRREYIFTIRNAKNEKKKVNSFCFPYRMQIISFLAVIIFFSCSSEEEGSVPNPTNPTVTSTQVSGITSETVISGGTITSNGGSNIIARGVCWSASHAPNIDDSKTTDGTGIGSFTSSLTGLIPNTTYYLKAYSSNNFGTSYGREIEFTTNTATVVLPAITSLVISEIYTTTSKSGGTVTSNGGSNIIARGVCWSTSHTPNIADSKTTDGIGTGSFTSSLTELLPNTTYYLRAYATNNMGTSYGEELGFTTSAISVVLPTITSEAISEISATTSKSGGNVTSNGGGNIIARGVCWSISNTPSTADSKTTDGTGIGNFTSYLTELLSNTTYYLRAYATNSVGTSYGEKISFTTGSTVYSGDVYLNTQQKVDNFGSMGYTIVTGDVVIEPSIPTNFSNLNGLSSLTSIGGSLFISKIIGLKNLTDFTNLTTVGHDIMLSYNQGLTSIGLDSLSSIGNSLFINLNEDLIDLDGLTNLRFNGGKPDLSILNNAKLRDFCGIKPLLSDFTGTFSVMSNFYNPTQQNILDGNCSQ